MTVVLPDDLDPTPDPPPYAALLPGLDPTTMGWQDRGWFLGEHAKALFDTNGNAGPTLWWDGRVVGGWAQRRSGEVVGAFGRNGRNAGQFHWIHAMAVDAKGNVYTAEVDTGKRIQKFKLTSDALR